MVSIKQDIPFKRIADIMTTAMECNDMTASWCHSAILAGYTTELYTPENNQDPWYTHPELYADPLLRITVTMQDDDDPAREMTYASIHKGLQLMADKEGRHFADFMAESDDAVTADVFLQLCVFGEVIFG